MNDYHRRRGEEPREIGCSCPVGMRHTGCPEHGFRQSDLPVVRFVFGHWFIDETTSKDSVFVAHVDWPDTAWVAMAECTQPEMMIRHFLTKTWATDEDAYVLPIVFSEARKLQDARQGSGKKSRRWETLDSADVDRVINALRNTGTEAELVAADVLRAVYAKRGRKKVVVIGNVLNGV